MDLLIKKKRGRKPKNFFESTEEPVVIVEKKKRGRKKKYEIENSEKILNRNEENNFDHSVAYSDDDEIIPCKTDPEQLVKKIAFGNLDITVSKKINVTPAENYRNQLKFVLNESKLTAISSNLVK